MEQEGQGRSDMSLFPQRGRYETDDYLYDYDIEREIQYEQRCNTRYAIHKKFIENSREFNEIEGQYDIRDSLRNSRMIPLSEASLLNHDTYSGFPPDLIQICRVFQQGSRMPLIPILLGMLALNSSVMRGKVKIKLTESWSESLILWFLCGADSGMGKSAIMGKLINPLSDFQSIQLANYEKNGYLTRNNLKIISKEAEREKINIVREKFKQRSNIGSIDFENITNEIASIDVFADQMKSEFSDVFKGQLFVENQTPHQLISLLNEYGFTTAISSEGSLIKKLIKASDTDLTPFLKSYNQEGGTYQFNRRMVTLHNPGLTMIMFTQPKYVSEFLSDNNLNEMGMCSRVIPYYVLGINPDTPIIDRGFTDNELAEGAELYKKKMLSLGNLYVSPNINPESLVIETDESAYNRLKQFEEEILEEHIPSSPPWVQAWLRKGCGLASRLAGCLVAWSNEIPHEAKISQVEMNNGIRLVTNALSHIQYVYSEHGYEAHKNARKIVRYLLNIDPTMIHDILTFGLESRKILQGVGLNREQANNALTLLEKHNFLGIFRNGSSNLKIMLHPDFYEYRYNPMLTNN